MNRSAKTVRLLSISMICCTQLFMNAILHAQQPGKVTIAEGVYEGRKQFVVKTAHGEYWFDRAGGGFSKLIDLAGKDWISFKKDPLNKVPESAGAGFRGMPNCVYVKAGVDKSIAIDGGCGHPGFDLCKSDMVNDHTIRTVSLSGRWQWRWEFFEQYALFTVEKTPGNQPYWFLYEGTPGGEWSPANWLWGTNFKAENKQLDFLAGQTDVAHWDYIYFGHKLSDHTLLFTRLHRDHQPDVFGMMANSKEGLNAKDGMTVLGFGRGPKSTPLFYHAGAQFAVAILPVKIETENDRQTKLAKAMEAIPHYQPHKPKSKIDPAKLTQALDYLKANVGDDGVKKMVINQHGVELYRGSEAEQIQGVWSITKSFTSSALGLLIDDGKCTLETKLADILPEMKEKYPNVTLRHLTTMTSGYRAIGDADPRPDGYAHGPSRTPFLPGEPLFAASEKYAYWDSAMNVFGLALTKIAGRPLDEYLQERMMSPIGIGKEKWQWGHFGEANGIKAGHMNVVGGSGNNELYVKISAVELAKVGELFLNQGYSKDGKIVISSKWVAMATQNQVPNNFDNAFLKSNIAGQGEYGFNWWALPDGGFKARGYNNNRMWIIPTQDLVIIRLGLDQKQKAINDQIEAEFVKILTAK